MKTELLTMYISNHWWKHLDAKQHAIKLAKTCKKIRDTTRDKELYRACREVIAAVQRCDYQAAIGAVTASEAAYHSAAGQKR